MFAFRIIATALAVLFVFVMAMLISTAEGYRNHYRPVDWFDWRMFDVTWSWNE